MAQMALEHNSFIGFVFHNFILVLVRNHRGLTPQSTLIALGIVKLRANKTKLVQQIGSCGIKSNQMMVAGAKIWPQICCFMNVIRDLLLKTDCCCRSSHPLARLPPGTNCERTMPSYARMATVFVQSRGTKVARRLPEMECALCLYMKH